MTDPGARLPSPEEVRGLREARRTVEATVPCRHTAEQLWPYLTQVDLYNREAGSSPVEYEVVSGAEGVPVIRGTSRKLGLTMRYRELPYEWQAPRFVHAELFYDNGPFRYARLRGEYLQDQEAVRYRVDYVPRRRFSLAGLLARGILKKLTTIVGRIDGQLPETFSDPLAVEGFADRSPAATRSAADLGRRWRDLAPDPVIAESVADFVATAPDRMVGRMRPYGLARQLGTTRRETLQFCLRAANEGFLELSWDLVCPSCRGAKRRVPDIADLGDAAHCEVCNIHYDADFSRNVEVSFRPVEAVRRIDEDEYCLQSPSNQREILAQINVEPHAAGTLPLALTPGHYRLRCIGREGEVLFDAAYARPRQEVVVSIGEALEAGEVSCGASVDLVVRNDSADWRTIRFEHHGYRENAATAADVSELEEFREGFAHQLEVLSARIAAGSGGPGQAAGPEAST